MADDELPERADGNGRWSVWSRSRAGVPRGRISGGVGALLFVLRDPVIVILGLAGLFDGLSGNPVHWIILLGAAVALGREALLNRNAAANGIVRASSPPPAPRLTVPMRELIADPDDERRAEARRLVFVPLALVGVFVYAVVVGGFARYSWPATIAVVLTGVIVLMASWPGPVHRRPEPGPLGTVGAVAWAGAFIGLGLWELTQLLLQPDLTTDSWAHPTISALSDPILASHPGRTIGLLAWLLFGWFLVRR